MAREGVDKIYCLETYADDNSSLKTLTCCRFSPKEVRLVGRSNAGRKIRTEAAVRHRVDLPQLQVVRRSNIFVRNFVRRFRRFENRLRFVSRPLSVSVNIRSIAAVETLVLLIFSLTWDSIFLTIRKD